MNVPRCYFHYLNANMSTLKNRHKAFPIGYQLQKYKIQSILKQGEFSITYLAEDTQHKVVIKEYLPSKLAVRKDDYTLQPRTLLDVDNFAWGLEQFTKEARILEGLKHPNIVHVQHVFQANNTVYLVMNYEPGQSLAELYKVNEVASKEDLIAILPPLLSALQTIHKANTLHYNLKPANIYLRDTDQSPVLIGFGAMNYKMDTLGMAITDTPYAPFEQYQSEGNQGTWTDIYGLGAVLYRLVSGTIPHTAIERIDAIVYAQQDPLPLTVEIADQEYPQALLEAIDWAIETRDTDRPQSLTEWASAIPPQFLPASLVSSQTKKRNFWWILVILGIVLGSGYLLYSKWQAGLTTIEKPQLVDNTENNQPENTSKAAKDKPVALTKPSIDAKKNEPPIKTPVYSDESTEPLLDLQPLAKQQVELEEQPVIQVEPAQFIQSYYMMINNRQYDASWLMLSPRFKDKYHCCKADGSHDLNSYLNWWNKIKTVEILRVETLEYNAETATLKAELRYSFKNKNRVIPDTHTFKLIKDINNTWLIEQQL